MSFDKINDYFKSNSDLKSAVSADHLDLLKSKYLETKKAVKPLTLYFNLKKLLEDVENTATK